MGSSVNRIVDAVNVPANGSQQPAVTQPGFRPDTQHGSLPGQPGHQPDTLRSAPGPSRGSAREPRPFPTNRYIKPYETWLRDYVDSNSFPSLQLEDAMRAWIFGGQNSSDFPRNAFDLFSQEYPADFADIFASAAGIRRFSWRSLELSDLVLLHNREFASIPEWNGLFPN